MIRNSAKIIGDLAVSAPADTLTVYDNVNRLYWSDFFLDVKTVSVVNGHGVWTPAFNVDKGKITNLGLLQQEVVKNRKHGPFYAPIGFAFLRLDHSFSWPFCSISVPCSLLSTSYCSTWTCCCQGYCYASTCFASPTSSSSHGPFLSRSKSPWPGWFSSLSSLFPVLSSSLFCLSLKHFLSLLPLFLSPFSVSFSLVDAPFFSSFERYFGLRSFCY